MAVSSLDYAFQWVSLSNISTNDMNTQENTWSEEDRLMAIHPIYVIPWADVEDAHTWFGDKTGFE